MEEVCRLISPGSGGASTATHKSGLLSAPSLYQGCKRLSGPPLPPATSLSTSQTSANLPQSFKTTRSGTVGLGGINDLLARLEHLAFAPRPEGGPPLVTYTTTPSEHGDVVSATEAYVEWFRRTYPAARRADSARVPAPGAPDQGEGRKSARLEHFNP